MKFVIGGLILAGKRKCKKLLLILKSCSLQVSSLVAGSGQCDSGWEYFGGRCYLFESGKRNYQEARIMCYTLHEQADLAIVDNANTLREIYNYIQEFGELLLVD